MLEAVWQGEWIIFQRWAIYIKPQWKFSQWHIKFAKISPNFFSKIAQDLETFAKLTKFDQIWSSSSVTKCKNKKWQNVIQKLPKNSHSSYFYSLKIFQN